MREKLLVIFLFLIMFCLPVLSQNGDSVFNSATKPAASDSDTMLIFNLEPIYFSAPSASSASNSREQQKRLYLIRNVKKAYYYAKLASEKLKIVDADLQKIHGKKEQKEYLEQAEKDLRAQFEEELKKLTITQGRILVKLIDRETGNTTYYLVKELRGSFSAFFWQSMARLFGSNLKMKYDPLGEDKDIEAIIQQIDKGLL